MSGIKEPPLQLPAEFRVLLECMLIRKAAPPPPPVLCFTLLSLESMIETETHWVSIPLLTGWIVLPRKKSKVAKCYPAKWLATSHLSENAQWDHSCEPLRRAKDSNVPTQEQACCRGPPHGSRSLSPSAARLLELFREQVGKSTLLWQDSEMLDLRAVRLTWLSLVEQQQAHPSVQPRMVHATQGTRGHEGTPPNGGVTGSSLPFLPMKLVLKIRSMVSQRLSKCCPLCPHSWNPPHQELPYSLC